MIVDGNKTSSPATARQRAARGARLAGIVPALLAGLSLAALAGCSHQEKKAEPQALGYPPGTSFAIAPAINASNCPDIDPVKLADLMASEFTSFPGVGVISVNRVLAVLAEQRVAQVTSAEHALALCDRLGADAIVIFAVTEYNPYTPVVGMTAEVYGRERTTSRVDPVATSRMARPWPVPPEEKGFQPWAQVQRTFNAEHKAIQDEVKKYAETRDGKETPFGWRKYLASQEYYLRYCCHAVARDLIQ